MALRRWLLAAVAVPLVATAALTGGTATAAPPPTGPPDFGPNVKVFDPSMPTSEIQATVDAVASQQVDNEMGTQRYALLFKPGTYGTPEHPLVFQVGYDTEVAGLGLSPTDVTINGHVDVYNRCLTPTNCIALVNFWRSLANLTINVTGLTDCRASGDFWAVSQAAPMRRVNITGGNLTLMDYCTADPHPERNHRHAVRLCSDDRQPARSTEESDPHARRVQHRPVHRQPAPGHGRTPPARCNPRRGQRCGTPACRRCQRGRHRRHHG